MYGETSDPNSQISAFNSLLTHCRRLRVSVLASCRVPRAALSFPIVALLADFALTELLLAQACDLSLAHLIGYTLGFVIQSIIIARTLKARFSSHRKWPYVAIWLALGLMVASLRTGSMVVATQLWGWSEFWAVTTRMLVSQALLFGGAVLLTSPARTESVKPARLSRILPFVVIGYLALLRLLYLGLSDLLVEEAYYWNYARHLDWGYLDHPPMVAWLIGAGTTILGQNEFAVRIGSFIAWSIAALFLFKLARDLYGRTVAIRAVMLISCLPFFFGVGLIATPDAPLVACWAGLLYFLQRALIGQHSNAWWGAGICLGLGLLSKYTIGLLLPASLLFMLIDSRARHWFRKPQPYLALALAGLLFAPVIYWNAQHEWVSFLFQSARRLRESTQFSLHLLLASALFLITPTGFLAAITALFRSRFSAGIRHIFSGQFFSTRLLFEVLFCAVPLSVFAAFSLTHEPKLNWTGPSWLVLLPMMAAGMALVRDKDSSPLLRFVRRIWVPTILTMVVLYGAALNWLNPGLSGLAYPASMKDIAGWKQLGAKVDTVVRQVAESTGRKPLIVGLDRYNISSELAFYTREAGPSHCAGVHLFEQNGLMYRYWFPAQEQIGRDIVMVARTAQRLSESEQTSRFDSLSTVRELPVTLNGIPVGSYFTRVGFGYRVNR